MTPPRTRQVQPAVLAAAAAALLLTGCATTPQSGAAPNTWAIPTNPAAATTLQPRATPAGVTSDPAPAGPVESTTSPPSPVNSPGQDGTTAQPGVQLLNPTFDQDQINRADPTQVAWAYLNHRLTYSHTDAGPGAGIQLAVQYATPDLTAELGQVLNLAVESWQQVQITQTNVIATITSLTTFITDAQATVIATWTLTVDTAKSGPRTTESLTTTVVLTLTAAGEWQVATDNLSRPD